MLQCSPLHQLNLFHPNNNVLQINEDPFGQQIPNRYTYRQVRVISQLEDHQFYQDILHDDLR